MSQAIRRAFTLIELLTVIAITAVLLTIIVVPIVQTFNLTRLAQAFQEGQDRARIVTERIAREMSNSAGVRNNTGIGGQINVVVPAGPGSHAPVAGSQVTRVPVPLSYAKIDLQDPSQEGDKAGGGFVDPNTGRIDPTLQAPKGQVGLSVAPGTTITRYWVGLRQPFAMNGANYVNNPYNNPYQVWDSNATDGSTLKTRTSGRDNLYVLYRAQVVTYVFRLDKNNTPGSGALRPNLNFFQSDATDTKIIDQDDPDFFRPNGDLQDPGAALPTAAADVARLNRIQHWMSKGTVITELSRYDMILPFYDKASLKVVFDQTTDGIGTVFAPRLISLVSFKPSRVQEGAAEGMLAVRSGEESDNAVTLAPDVYMTKSAGWSNATVTMFPVFTDPTRTSPLWSSADPFAVGRMPYLGQPSAPTGFSVYGIPGGFVGDPTRAGVELFDVAAYEAAVGDSTISPYAFTYGLQQANSRSSWLTTPALKAQYLPVFAPYDPDGNLGRIIASFGIDQVGTNAAFAANNLPYGWNGPEVTPANDLPASPPTYKAATLAAINTGTFSDPDFASTNRKFNKVWFDYPSLRPDIHRFLDLRVTPQADGTASPLDPTSGFPRGRIVPGSEEVVGPDQRPGPYYGNPIRYTRTTNPTVGPNQYRINYVDQPEPDYTNPGLGLPSADVTAFYSAGGVYSATNFVSAVYQPRFKAGYLQFNSDPNVPLPVDDASTPAADDAAIHVYYKFQFTQAVKKPGQTGGVGVGDTFAVEYDSRQLMSVQVTIRNYPQSTLPTTETVTLKAEAPIRNFLR